VAKQTANNASSQAASTKSVTFSRQAAQRIAKVVRTVEGGNRNQPGIRFDHPQPGSGGSGVMFRVATFTGSWGINSSKTVTFVNQTNTPNTASVSNLYFDYPEPTGNVTCGIAKEGTAWFLIDVPINYATAVFAEETTSASFLTGVDISASLSTADCSITVNKTLTSGEAVFIVPESTFTAQFLTFKVD
jgi:hypothetical protein